jgi:hypothetical protein
MYDNKTSFQNKTKHINMKLVYNQVRDQVHTKIYKFRIQLRGQLRKQVSKQHGLQYKGWVQIQEQIINQLKQNRLI